jgi:hypothetical protein
VTSGRPGPESQASDEKQAISTAKRAARFAFDKAALRVIFISSLLGG